MKKEYLWQNKGVINKLRKNAPNTVDFVTNTMNQNLDHARHIENERLSYCACMTALVAGIFAFRENMDTTTVYILYTALLLLIIISVCLTERWNRAFDRHIMYAKGCYYMLQAAILGEAYEADDFDKEEIKKTHKDKASKEDLYIPVMSGNDKSTDEYIYPLKSMALYCFKIDNPRWIFRKLQTKWIFRAYYIILFFAVMFAIIYTRYTPAVPAVCGCF